MKEKKERKEKKGEKVRAALTGSDRFSITLFAAIGTVSVMEGVFSPASMDHLYYGILSLAGIAVFTYKGIRG